MAIEADASNLDHWASVLKEPFDPWIEVHGPQYGAARSGRGPPDDANLKRPADPDGELRGRTLEPLHHGASSFDTSRVQHLAGHPGPPRLAHPHGRWR